MGGNAVVSINALPVDFAVSGGGSFCAGDTGVHIFLASSESGVNYQLYNGSETSGDPVAGTGDMLDFGAMTEIGTYTVFATNATTGCVNSMDGSANISINALPLVFNITGGGLFCVGGTGVDVGLSGSQTGINYQLYYGSALASVVPGTSLTLDFGNQTIGGSYTVLAQNTSTSCQTSMTGNATVVVQPVPTIYSMTGGGSFCSSGTGVNVGVSGSDAGVIYQLYNGSGVIGSPLTGTGYPMLFGLQTADGSYGVVAYPDIASCTTMMSGSSMVNVLPLPTEYSVEGGGNYCPGGNGVHVYLNNSDIGMNYQLYANNVPVGVNMPGTSGAIDFGLQTIAGNYTVTATNGLTGCINTMEGSVTVAVNPLPAAFSVMGGGSFCVGGAGEDISLEGTEAGTTYQLMLGVSPTGAAITGGSGAIDFGVQTIAGTYTVAATNTSTGCTTNMSGSAIVGVNPLPNIYTVTGGGNYCSGGTGSAVGLNGSDAGVNY